MNPDEESKNPLAPDTGKGGGTKKKVVVIEDDGMLGSILMKHMVDEHMNARLLTSAENALEGLKRYMPDLLVLDVFLPNVNGLDFLESLRKDPLTKNIKVLVVSNTDLPADSNRATALGAEFMIKAAATPADIVSKVKEMLARP